MRIHRVYPLSAVISNTKLKSKYANERSIIQTKHNKNELKMKMRIENFHDSYAAKIVTI